MVAPKAAVLPCGGNFPFRRGHQCQFCGFPGRHPGRAKERCIANGHCRRRRLPVPTTFEKEVFSDLVGERGVLYGA